MFDINGWEFLVMAVIALLVLGPEKLPRYVADAARMVRQVRRLAEDARTEVTRELGPEFQNISLDDLNPRSFVKKHLFEGEEPDLNLDFDVGDITGDKPSRRPTVTKTTTGSAATPNPATPSPSGPQKATPVGLSKDVPAPTAEHVTPPWDADAT